VVIRLGVIGSLLLEFRSFNFLRLRAIGYRMKGLYTLYIL
jgi:hypothetical protein